MNVGRDKILFIGAGGAVAHDLLPRLVDLYDIVGVIGRRDDLASYCVESIHAELTIDADRVFNDVFSRHHFHAVIWNAVRYHPGPLIKTSRGTLHLEFDIAVALPIECVRTALAHGFSGVFIFVTSGLAFGTKPSWGSYSIAKRGQVIAAEYLSQELAPLVRTRAVALGTISTIPDSTLRDVFRHAIEDREPGKTLYQAYGDTWD